MTFATIGDRAVMLVLLVTSSSFVTTGNAQAAELEFKGVQFGATQEQFIQAHPAYYCERSKGLLTSDSYCSLSREIKCLSLPQDQRGACEESVKRAETYGGYPVKSIVARFYDGMGLGAARIIYNPNDFEKILVLLTEKYSKPSSFKTENIQNRMGAIFENAVAEWEIKTGKIRLEKYSAKVDEGTLVIHSSTNALEFKRRADAAKSGRKSDL